MADVVLSFTIPEAKVAKTLAALLDYMPKPVGSVLTDAQWAKQVIKDWVMRIVQRHAVKLSVPVQDDSVIT